MAKLLWNGINSLDFYKQYQLMEMGRRMYSAPRQVKLSDKQIECELMLHTLRHAIVRKPPSPPTDLDHPVTSLTGNPTCYTFPQNIRAEILERWSSRTTSEIQREWLKNSIYY